MVLAPRDVVQVVGYTMPRIRVMYQGKLGYVDIQG